MIACRFGEQLGLNVRHYRSVAVVGAGVPPSAVATAIFASLGPLYVNILTASASFESVSVAKILPLPRGMSQQTTDTPLVGLQVGDPLPKQVAGLISLRTLFSGRRFRGRMYIPFPPEILNELPDARPSASYLTVLGTIASFVIAPLPISVGADSETFLPVVLHRDDLTDTFIFDAMVRPVWATQRRRGDFGRTNPASGAGGSIIIEPNGL